MAHESTYHHLHQSPLPGSESHDCREIWLTLCACCVERFPCPQQGLRVAFPRCAWWDEHNAFVAWLSFIDHRRVDLLNPFCPSKHALNKQNIQTTTICKHTLQTYAIMHWISKICNLGSLIWCIPRGLRQRHNRVAYDLDHLQIRTKKEIEPCRIIRGPC